mmetsp:Transcript_9341/g.20649  ORF Transcript_9341/g.20649 Transcript_9341/m.20649 type:complete len:150 (-) Transcript_9341:207-656(-)
MRTACANDKILDTIYLIHLNKKGTRDDQSFSERRDTAAGGVHLPGRTTEKNVDRFTWAKNDSISLRAIAYHKNILRREARIWLRHHSGRNEGSRAEGGTVGTERTSDCQMTRPVVPSITEEVTCGGRDGEDEREDVLSLPPPPRQRRKG